MIYQKGNTSSSGAAVNSGDVIGQVPPLYPAATNLLLQSAQFDNASWTNAGGGIVVTPDTTVAPNGITEADTINDNSAVILGELDQAIAIANDNSVYTGSIWIKAGTSTQVKCGVRLIGGATVESSAELNPNSGLTIGLVGTATITAVTVNGVAWFLLTFTVTNNTSGNVTAQFYIQPASLNAGATGTVIAWGGQFETGAAATGWIPTRTVTQARQAGIIPQWLQAPRYSQTYFTANGNYTVPPWILPGNTVYVSGRGAGGGSGAAAAAATIGATGGGSGALAMRVPIAVTPGQVVAVTIGTGGAGGIDGGAAAQPGTQTLFGGLLTINGGAPGQPGTVGVNVPGANGGTKSVAGTMNGTPSQPAGSGVGTNGGGEGGGIGNTGAGAGSPGIVNTGGGAGGCAAGAGNNGGQGGSGWLMVETM